MDAPEPELTTTPQQTGPKTRAGKSVSSQNATTHGGTSQKLIVAGENQADFDALLTGLRAEYTPETETANRLVEDFAHAQWYLWRRIRACNSVEHALYEAYPDPATWPDSAFTRLNTVERYRTTAERSFQRAYTNLDHLQHTRISATNSAQRQTNFETRLTLDRERLALQQDRHALTKSRFDIEQKEIAYDAACAEFDVPTVTQWIDVTINFDQTTTSIYPSNEEIRATLEQGEIKPEQVCREYRFLDGVPHEYWWNDECASYQDRHGHRIQQLLTKNTWLAMADQELARNDGHAVSGLEFFW